MALEYVKKSGKDLSELQKLDEAMDFLAWSCKFDLTKPQIPIF